jgi:3alpha(or 20beta)-hydroxysteroid dehydrogenase
MTSPELSAGRVAAVTGGAGGIGLGIVRHLLDAGWSVVASDWDEAASAAARDALDVHGSSLRIVTCDIGTAEGAALAVDTAIAEFGRLDLLCNNAALHPLEEIAAHDLTSWRETFRVNVDGTMLCSRRALAHMIAAGGGTIVNMGSIAGAVPYATGGAYGASKAAIALMTRVMAMEAGPHGITVNCIAPGSIQHRAPVAGGGAPPSHIPIGRRGTVEDVAELVAWLASDGARYMTGAVLPLDGGATAGRQRQRP